MLVSISPTPQLQTKSLLLIIGDEAYLLKLSKCSPIEIETLVVNVLSDDGFFKYCFDSYLLTRHRAHQLWLSLILPKILFLPVKILQRFQDTLYNPVKLFSTAPEFQLSPVSLTDKIRHLDRAHASLARCLVFVHCIRALDAARLISRNEL